MCTAQRIFRLLVASLCFVYCSVVVAQRFTLETQAPGGFVLLNSIDSISGTDLVGCGVINEGGFLDYGIVCRISNNVALWSHKLSSIAGTSTFWDVTTTPNGEVIIVGEEWRGARNCLIVKLDQLGTLLWSTSVNFGPEHQYFTSSVVGDDGSIYVIGQYGTSGQTDDIIAKFSSSGISIWSKLIDLPYNQSQRSVLMIQDTLWISGESSTPDLTLKRFSRDGDLLSYRSIGTSAPEWISSMAPNGSGGVVLQYVKDPNAIGVVHVSSTTELSLPCYLIFSSHSLNIHALDWNTSEQEYTFVGMAWNSSEYFATAFRISPSSGSIIWERSFPSLQNWLGLTQTASSNEVIVVGTPKTFNINGNFPAEFVRLNVLNGTDYIGSPCEPSTTIHPTVTASTLNCIELTVPVITPTVTIINGIEQTPLPLQMSMCSPTVLPIQLAQWIAEPLMNAVRLTWTNGSVSDHFEIERSVDAQDWKKIGTVEGQSSGAIHHYAWTDVSPVVGTNYYRLQQIDPDGSSSYSPVLSAEPLRGSQFQAFPNPVAPGAAVTVTDPVEVFNLNGERVGSGSKTFAAPVVPGVYVLRCNALSSLLFVQ